MRLAESGACKSFTGQNLVEQLHESHSQRAGVGKACMQLPELLLNAIKCNWKIKELGVGKIPSSDFFCPACLRFGSSRCSISTSYTSFESS